VSASAPRHKKNKGSAVSNAVVVPLPSCLAGDICTEKPKADLNGGGLLQ